MMINNDNENDNDGYADITSIFEGAVDSLSYTNPIICDESTFNLYDTMAALELMDTKMDSCEIDSSFYRYSPTSPNDQDKNDEWTGKRITVPPRPAPKKINDVLTPLPWENLTLKQARIIIMEISTRFESMVSGSNIAESVYTCLYAHDNILADMKARLEHDSNYCYKNDIDNGCMEDGKAESNFPSKEETRAARWSVYASALMLVKLTQLVRRIVQHADIYEEEDFSLSTYGFTFFRDGGRKEQGGTPYYSDRSNSLDNIGNDINNSQDDEHMLDVLKVCISAKDAIRVVVEDGVSDRDEEDSEKSINVKIIERSLDFYVDLYTCCATLGKLTKDDVLEKATSMKKRIEKGIQNVDVLISMEKGRIEKALLDISNDRKAMSETITPQPSNNDNNEHATILLQTFDPNVNRHLLGNSPVRKVTFNDPLQSLQYLRILFHSIDWAVCSLLLRGDTIDRIRCMLSHVSTSSINVNILVRSLVVLNLYFDDLVLGRHMLPVEIAKHMHRHGVPKPITDTVYGLKFLDRLGKPMYDTLKLLTLNRNRQRAYLDSVIFGEWGALQLEATEVDRAFCEEFDLGGAGVEDGVTGSTTMPFVSNYVLGLTVGLMVHYLTLGIELNLVTGHHDLGTTYWYLDFLLSTQLNVANSMRASMQERRALQAKIESEEAAIATKAAATAKNGGGANGRHALSGSKSEKGKKKGGKKLNRKGGNNKTTKTKIVPTKPIEIEQTPEDREDNIELLMLEMRRTKCRGIVRFISALNQAEIVTLPTYTFTTQEICFQKRFHSFRFIHQPRLLTFDDFQAGSDYSSVSGKTLLTSTTGCFKTCRAIIDVILKQHLSTIDPEYRTISKEEALSLVKVCVGNSLFLHKLCQAVDEGETKAISYNASFNFKVHKQFCSITLS